MKFSTRFRRFGITASHDRLAYRDYQFQIGSYYLQHCVAPFASGKTVFDIGCAEGGLLTAFEQAGYNCTGLEYSAERVQYARENSSTKIKFIAGDIQTISLAETFDVILMLDVIEHLDDKLTALKNIRQLMPSQGILIISFPPFRSPFGGHQQVMKSVLKYIPYIQLLPEAIYKWLLERIERENVAAHLRNFKTGITIRGFEKLVVQAGLEIVEKKTFFVRPRQALKFNLEIRHYRLNFLEEYLATGVDYVLKRSIIESDTKIFSTNF